MRHHDCHLLSGKLYWKLSKPREVLLASVTSASTKTEERGVTRSGEGARWSDLRPLALLPLWWYNHGHMLQQLLIHLLPLAILSILVFPWICPSVSWPTADVSGTKALQFFLSYFSATSIPPHSCGTGETIGDGGERAITKHACKQSLRPSSFTWPFSPFHSFTQSYEKWW